jgi:adenosine deaminase
VDTLRELSRQHQLDYPHDDEEEFKKRIMLLSPTTSLTQFLEVFGAICNILCTKEAVERVAYEYCEELGRQNVVYFELRHNPMGKKMEPEQYVEGVTAGLERGEKDFGVKSRQILAFIRGKPGTVGVKFGLLASCSLVRKWCYVIESNWYDGSMDECVCVCVLHGRPIIPMH